MDFWVRKLSGNFCVKCLGNLDETLAAATADVLPKLKKLHVEFDLSSIKSVNSIGIRQWTEFLEQLSQQTTFEFQNCPITYVEYCNLLPTMIFAKQVVSFAAPYKCRACGD